MSTNLFVTIAVNSMVESFQTASTGEAITMMNQCFFPQNADIHNLKVVAV